MAEVALERGLTDLGRHLAWPERPDLAAAVRAEIEGAAVVPLRPRRGRRAAVLAAAFLLMLAALLAASPGIRAALLELFRLPGARIEVERTPSPAPAPMASPSLEDLVPGRRVSLAEARRTAAHGVVFPKALGRPDEVAVFGTGDDAVVTLAWRARPGLPAADETGYAVLLTEFRARPQEDLIKKTAEQTQVIPVVVDGEQGYWIEGPHSVLVRRGGSIVEDQARLSASSLLWTRDGVLLRLETDLTRAEALALAGSVR